MKSGVLAASLLLVGLAESGRALEAYVLEETIESPAVFGKAAESHAVTTWLAKGLVRKDDAERGMTTIIRTQVPRSITVLDRSKQTYFDLDEKALASIEEMGTALFSQLRGKEDGAIQKTDHVRTVGSWSCTEYVVEGMPMPGSSTTLCLSTEVGIDPSLLKQVADSPLALERGQLGQLLKDVRALDGYPVEMTTSIALGEQTIRSTQRLVAVKRSDVDVQTFDVPQGYTRVDSPLTGMLGAEQQ